MQDRFEYLKEHFLPRFWDSDGGGMILPELENGEITYVYWESQIDDWACCGYTLEDLLLNPRFIPMKPCGGSKDKRGKLMYDRDLLKPYFDECGYAEIRWNADKAAWGIWIKSWYLGDGEGGYGTVESDYEGWDDDVDIVYGTRNGGFEIIGNIHTKGDSDEK